MDLTTKKQIGRVLIYYLDIYISKPNLRMKPIIQRIKHNVLNNKPITRKQLGSVIKFLEREPRFSGCSKDLIYEFFTPLTDGYVCDEEQPQTLEPFFT